jgi:NADH-quinone oxidoreductase subunit H
MEFFILLVKVIVVLNLVLGLASMCTWIERKASALIQDRVGANRAGAYWQTDNILLKPAFWGLRWLGALGFINTLVCDSMKALAKEDFVPSNVSYFLHSLAPFMAVFPVILTFAVIPLAPDFVIAGHTIRPQVANIDAGILFVFAMGSLAVYGAAIAGWSGNNKFSMLGGLRTSAQMISYELAMGLAMVAVIVLYGTVNLYEMVQYQVNNLWGVVYQPVSFIVLFVAGMAETKRAPFDLPESESELVAGYLTEYSGMKFLLFWLGEFAEIALVSVIMVIVFFGGWDIPFVTLPEGTWYGALLGHLALMAKVVFFCVLQIVIRWTLPRFRYDQLMNLGWKILLPIGMLNLVVCAVFKLLF